MADQLRWFKVWTSIALDPTFLSLPVDAIGQWVLLGAWTAAHGNEGVLVAKESAIRHTLRLRDGDVTLTLQKLPHLSVTFRDGEYTVTFLNWQKYQKDSTHAARQKRYRDRERDGDKRRGEERRVKTKDSSSNGLPKGFSEWWQEYPKKVGKVQAVKEWERINPDDILLAKILEALRKQKLAVKAMRENDKEHILDPERWIKYRRWEDELPIGQMAVQYPRLV